jgi:hypothetical protein
MVALSDSFHHPHFYRWDRQSPRMKIRFSRHSRSKSGEKRSVVRQVATGCGYVFGGVIAVALVAIMLVYLRLTFGPVGLGTLPDALANAMSARMGPGWSVALRDTALELDQGSPALRANGLDVRDPNGALVVTAPYATVSIDTWSLLSASLQPRAIELRDLQIRAVVGKDGSLSFSPAELPADTAPPPPENASPSAQAGEAANRAAAAVSPVSRAVGSLFELVIGKTGILNLLDTAKLTNAKLTLVDDRRRERAAFKRVDATFSRSGEGGRHFDATLDGPQGVWQLSGDAVALPDQQYRATLVAADAPLQDVLLLAGLSAVPATTDLKLSGRVDAGYAAGQVTELKARLESGKGVVRIDDKDTSPVDVDRAVIDVAWSEPDRRLNFKSLALKGGGNDVNLAGALDVFRPDVDWHLVLAGKDLTLSGALPADPPVVIADFSADLSGPDGLQMNFVRLRGSKVSADISGRFLTSADPKAVKVDMTAGGTDVRQALRLWPEAVAPPIRRFLVANLKDGTLDTIKLAVDMTGEDVTRATSGGPIADASVNIAFGISQGTLRPAEGLPPLSRMDVTGLVTGTTTKLSAKHGVLEMADGRSLDASDGAFTLKDYWNDDAVAQIGFRLQGSAEGVGALLQTPVVHEIARFEADPAAMKGRADLRVGIALAVNNMPPIADLPISVSGAINDLTVDKLLGSDKLENANVTLAYDKGILAIKGEGKVSGAPALIDLRQGRDGGEATVSLVMDEAARAKRGFSFGSQLTGPLTVKAVVPMGKDPKAGMRVEADLTKVAIDQLLPGWTKAAGRPGKMSLTLIDGTPDEIKDLQLDSGSVQLRGSALLTADGGLDKADLTTFKLSPGDDMRASVDLTNGIYKVTVRGNTGDARPFTKSLSGPSGARKDGKVGKDQPSKDVDFDLLLNILTGHNDEAITNAAVKASMRKDTLRALDVKGRLGATNLVSKMVPQAGGSPLIVLQSDNAGALLRFMDIYRRMDGGDMVVQLTTNDGPQDGTLMLRSFRLTNEPALRRIIPTQTQIVAGKDAAGRPKMVQVDTNQIEFAKARVDFTRNASRLDFKDAAIWGDSIGFTLGGYIDYARDRLDITGTFVPAYGLNNAFAQVPLFGPLLGGGQYEGLFAVNFRVSGAATAPTLAVNPLSAVAPGFLRKLFGAGSASQSDQPVPGVPER